MLKLIRFSRGSVAETKKVLRKGEYKPVCHIPFTKDLYLVGNERYGDYFRDMEMVEPFSHIPWVAWYIYGHYHCDKCRMCWSEWSYEGDGDSGCYIYGELRDTCRLLPPFRHLIGWPRKRKVEYFAAHEYDGYEEHYLEMERQQECMRKAMKKALIGYELIRRGADGKPIPVCELEFLNTEANSVFFEYEENAHPSSYTTLKADWKAVLCRTWNAFADHFRPFLPGKKPTTKIKKWWEGDLD